MSSSTMSSSNQPALAVLRDYPLDKLNTFGIKARAQAFLEVRSVADLQALREDSALYKMPRLVLGGGSNLLLTGDFAGLVLHSCNSGIEIVEVTSDATLVRAAAGESWHGLVQWTLARGLGGLENLSLIPGSVGAAPIQNIGAYGTELSACFHSLRAFDLTNGKLLQLDRAACAFGYRDSVFKRALAGQTMILDVTFALPIRWQPNLRYAELASALERVATPTMQQISDAVVAIRRNKLPDPAVLGNVGSFFKNPLVSRQQRDALLQQFPGLISHDQADGSAKLAAGWLIDQCGWKGRSMGAAAVYSKQALVLVNLGGASGADVVRLAQAIAADVQQRFGVTLEAEPVVID